MNEELESFYRLIKLKPHLKFNENNILTISLQRLLKGTQSGKLTQGITKPAIF